MLVAHDRQKVAGGSFFQCLQIFPVETGKDQLHRLTALTFLLPDGVNGLGVRGEKIGPERLSSSIGDRS